MMASIVDDPLLAALADVDARIDAYTARLRADLGTDITDVPALLARQATLRAMLESRAHRALWIAALKELERDIELESEDDDDDDDYDLDDDHDVYDDDDESASITLFDPQCD